MSRRLVVALVIILPVLCVTVFGCFTGSGYAITRGYTTNDSELRPGMVVVLTDGGSGRLPNVVRASTETQDKIIGVSTTTDTSLVSIASASAQVYVEDDGEALAYTSDINGTVKKGDLLAISPFRGVLMKAGLDQDLRIIAIAQQDFNEKSAASYPLSGADKKNALVASMKVSVNTKGGLDSALRADSPLTRLGRSITGKEVSDLRVLTALIVFFIVMLSEGAILYGAISTGITALGRNPLARKIIRAELLRVSIIVFGVLSVGLGAIYALLWI